MIPSGGERAGGGRLGTERGRIYGDCTYYSLNSLKGV